MSTPDPERAVLDYESEHGPDQPSDVGDQRVAAIMFIFGILLLVGVGMAVVVRFVLRSLL